MVVHPLSGMLCVVTTRKVWINTYIQNYKKLKSFWFAGGTPHFLRTWSYEYFFHYSLQLHVWSFNIHPIFIPIALSHDSIMHFPSILVEFTMITHCMSRDLSLHFPWSSIAFPMILHCISHPSLLTFPWSSIAFPPLVKCCNRCYMSAFECQKCKLCSCSWWFLC